MFFLLRGVVFSFLLERKIERFNTEYHAVLHVEKAGIRGISTIFLRGISLRPENGDTLLTIDTASASLGFWSLLVGRITVKELELNHTRLTILQQDSSSNYRFLLRGRKQKSQEDTVRKINYASVVSRMAGAVFEKIPSGMRITGLEVSYRKQDHLVKFRIDQFKVTDQSFHTTVSVTEGDTVKNWIVAGILDKKEQMASFRLYSSEKGKIILPFLQYKYKAQVSFDTLTFNLSENDREDTLSQIRGLVRLKGVNLQQEQISAQPVILDQFGFDYYINVGPDYIELDSATQVVFNRLNFHPYIRYRPGPTKQITLKIRKPEFPAEELFSSLPEGLFTIAHEVRVTGNLAFNLDFFVDLELPDSLRFQADLKRIRFGVLSYGDAGLMRLDSSFEYTAYVRGNPDRTFIVGPENPDFRHLSKISPMLQVSVLNSEDPGFFQHRGFIPDAFRESMIQNIKERRFARGGSTITMQLVKNVFLTKNKTISRKLEEILLVWLIENQQLCTKERMFEVYLNIIELGPHIYGANEAAHFYFKKDASRLNLQESIFLASIIPKPRWFMYSFDETGHLRQGVKDFFALLSGKMLKKGQISQNEYERLVPDVELKGPARLLLKSDTIRVDTTEVVED
ncbi:MAG: transglycosylase domain-containing protein [Bacteroidetes bacterium]|nr:transglycosylase domain-containing protein [Bacteroidota bacterium]